MAEPSTAPTATSAPATQSAAAPAASQPDSIDSLFGGPTAEEMGGGEPAAAIDAEPDATEPAGETVAETAATAADPDQRIQELARQYGVDPNDPAVRKMLNDIATTEKRNADKDRHIADLKSRQSDLTEFEKSLLETKPAPEGKQPPEAAPRTSTGERVVFNDIGDQWTSEGDGYKAWLEALHESNDTGNWTRFHEVNEAIDRRKYAALESRLTSLFQRGMEHRLRTFMDQDLADVIPPVRQTNARQRAAENREFALQELEKIPGNAEVVKALFKEEDGTVEFNGKQHPNNPVNRILAKEPEILNIRVDRHPQTGQYLDRDTADRLTKVAQYRAVIRRYREQQNGGLRPDSAKQLIQAGATMAQRDAQQRARAGTNAGSTAGDGKNPAADDYASELQSFRPNGLSLKDLLR